MLAFVASRQHHEGRLARQGWDKPGDATMICWRWAAKKFLQFVDVWTSSRLDGKLQGLGYPELTYPVISGWWWSSFKRHEWYTWNTWNIELRWKEQRWRHGLRCNKLHWPSAFQLCDFCDLLGKGKGDKGFKGKGGKDSKAREKSCMPFFHERITFFSKIWESNIINSSSQNYGSVKNGVYFQ